jgi:hypothetical protein
MACLNGSDAMRLRYGDRWCRRCLRSKRSGTDKPLVGCKLSWDIAGQQSGNVCLIFPTRMASPVIAIVYPLGRVNKRERNSTDDATGWVHLLPRRQAAIDHAIEVMAQGLPWGAALRAFTRDEMHER